MSKTITPPKNCPSCNSVLKWVKDQLFCMNDSCPTKNSKLVGKSFNYMNVSKNYGDIQKEMEKNVLPTKKNMIKQISDIINNQNS